MAEVTVVPFSWQTSLPQHGEEPRPAPAQAAVQAIIAHDFVAPHAW